MPLGREPPPVGATASLGLSAAINHLLVMSARELEGREASPTAGVIDSQSGRTTGSGGVRGFDAGKKIRGRKRHILTDTLGLLLFVIVHAASVQDRDGAPDLLEAVRHRFPWLRHVFAAGGKRRGALKGHGDRTIEVIRRSDAGLRGPAATPGGRAHLRLPRTMPPRAMAETG
jgi:putative transposase